MKEEAWPLLGMIRHDLVMRKSYFVCVVIGRHRPVRAPTVTGRLCFSVGSVWSGRRSADRVGVAVQSRCDNRADINKTKITLKLLEECDCITWMCRWGCTFQGDWRVTAVSEGPKETHSTHLTFVLISETAWEIKQLCFLKQTVGMARMWQRWTKR